MCVFDMSSNLSAEQLLANATELKKLRKELRPQMVPGAYVRYRNKPMCPFVGLVMAAGSGNNVDVLWAHLSDVKMNDRDAWGSIDVTDTKSAYFVLNRDLCLLQRNIDFVLLEVGNATVAPDVRGSKAKRNAAANAIRELTVGMQGMDLD